MELGLTEKLAICGEREDRKGKIGVGIKRYEATV